MGNLNVSEKTPTSPDTRKPRRTRKSAKQAGAAFERLIANYLAVQLEEDGIDRRPKRGVKDRGDIGGVKFFGHRIVLECKDVSRDNLPAWVREAEVEAGNDDALLGVVVHKYRGVSAPGEQFVTMTVDSFISLLLAGVNR